MLFSNPAEDPYTPACEHFSSEIGYAPVLSDVDFGALQFGDALRAGEAPTAERFAPAWSELLARAVEEPGLICEAYSRFHGYSLGNRLAAQIQCEMRGLEPGPLNSFNGWRKLGYGVQEGQKALTLCMPLKGTLHREKKGSASPDGQPNGAQASNGQPDVEAVEYIRAFVWKPSWFVLSQTVPLSENTEAVSIAAPTGWDRDLALRALDITSVPFDITDGNALGFASARTVAVSPLSPTPFKTLFHELGHVVLGHTTANFRGEGNAALELSDGETLSSALIEVEAESVALLLLATLDLPGQEFCRGYIQHWLSGPDGLKQDIPEKSAQRIFGAADRILCAGVGETRVRAPTAEEIGLHGTNDGVAHSAVAVSPAPPAPAAQSVKPIAVQEENGVPPPSVAPTPVPAPQRLPSERPGAEPAHRADATSQSENTAPVALALTPARSLSSGRVLSQETTRPAPENNEGAAWSLHGELQQIHGALHPRLPEIGARFASALRHLKARDEKAAHTVQQLVKSASRDLKRAYQQMETILEGDVSIAHNMPDLEANEFDPFAGMGAGQVLHTDYEVPTDFLLTHPTIERSERKTIQAANGNNSANGAMNGGEAATPPPLSPKRHAAARRTVARTLKAELEFEKDRFTKAAKAHELPMGRAHQKAMLAALSAYLEVPLTSQRDVSSHQWARGASAIETEDLRWL